MIPPLPQAAKISSEQTETSGVKDSLSDSKNHLHLSKSVSDRKGASAVPGAKTPSLLLLALSDWMQCVSWYCSKVHKVASQECQPQDANT